MTMPLAIILIAMIFIVTGFKGTTGDLFTQIRGDAAQIAIPFIAIILIGAVGYIPGLKKISDGFLALVLVGMFLSNKGFFAKFNQQLHAIATTGSTATPLTPQFQLGNLAPLPALPSLQNPLPQLSFASSLPGG